MKAQSLPKAPKSRKPARGGVRNRKKATRFVVARPSARTVFLAGDFNAWDAAAIPLAADGDVWLAEIDLPPGRHEYLFVIDGQWDPDPNAESVPNPFGGTNSVIVIED
jgi:1,4-alpha-glucan branching enzyme